MNSIQYLRLQRDVEHLHKLGPRALAELLLDIVGPVGEIELLLNSLERYRQVTPELLQAVGGDRFPPRLSLVPVVA